MSAEQITHPAWCDPSRCIPRPDKATPNSPQVGEHRSSYGEHRSALVPGGWGEAFAYLSQPIAPWECSVFLKIGYADRTPEHSFTLEPDSPLLLMMRQHVADQQARYPNLVPPLQNEAV